MDYVAGATQSGNAFYYGVIEALEQARPRWKPRSRPKESSPPDPNCPE